VNDWKELAESFDDVEYSDLFSNPSSSKYEPDLLKIFVSTFTWDYYAFTIHDRRKLINGDLKAYYRCRFVRSKGCKASLSVICTPCENDAKDHYKRTYALKNTHSCGEQNMFDTHSEEPLNIQYELRTYVEQMCLQDTNNATHVGRIALDYFHTKYAGNKF